MLKKGIVSKVKPFLVSGSGNVAQYAIEKAMALGAKVVTCSDSAGYVYLPEGFDREKLEALLELKKCKTWSSRRNLQNNLVFNILQVNALGK